MDDDLVMKYNEEKCLKFYYQVLADWSRDVGVPPDDEHIPGAPEGFIDFLKDHPKLRIKYGHRTEQLVKCWNCGTEYSIRDTHCPNPKCGKFNPKRSSIR
jgi:hypothetical protein